jgi:glycosyltransferase involved in cell wall biosynthesis
MSSPLVSVCIGSFNREEYIRETLESVFAQTYPNLEVIVVDDASTDGTVGLIREFGDRVTLIRSEENSGLPAVPRNIPMAHAQAGVILHFLWGEFAVPRELRRFKGRGAKVVGTFHCSARRLPLVLGNYRCLESIDRISVMLKSPIPFFVERGFPADRIDITPHGVDTRYCRPSETARALDGTLRLLIVGSTKRDHKFAATVMRMFDGAPVRLSDEELRSAYREADLFFMPLLDCTANYSLLEMMAISAPVRTNSVGGIPECVGSDCNFITGEKDVAEWRVMLHHHSRSREKLWKRRPAVRTWDEEFGWRKIVRHYRAFDVSARLFRERAGH